MRLGITTSVFLSALTLLSLVNAADERVVTFRSDGMELLLEEVASTGTVIWAMDFVDAGTMIFTERPGAIKFLQLETWSISEITGGPSVFRTDSGGLFDVLVDPDFQANRFVYFT
jgi:glucose/arabinose dehydrogenase